MFTLKTQVNDYEKWLVVRGINKATIKNYILLLKQMLDYLEGIGIEKPHDLTHSVLSVIDGWLSEKEGRDGSNITVRSRSGYINSFKSFTKYLESRGQLLFNIGEKLKYPKIVKGPRKIPSKEEIKILIDSIPLNNDWGLRHKVLISFLYYTGVRVGEASKIRVEDIDFEQRRIFICGKGEHERYVYLPRPFVAELKAYLKIERANPDLLFGVKDKRDLISIVTRSCKKIGLDQRGCHWLRYAMATHYFEAGVNPRIIQVLLGHKFLKSTFEYIHPQIDYLRQVHEKYHPFQRGFL